MQKIWKVSKLDSPPALHQVVGTRRAHCGVMEHLGGLTGVSQLWRLWKEMSSLNVCGPEKAR